MPNEAIQPDVLTTWPDLIVGSLLSAKKLTSGCGSNGTWPASELPFAPDKKIHARHSPVPTATLFHGTWLSEPRRQVFPNQTRVSAGGAWLPRVPGLVLFRQRLALRVPRVGVLGLLLAIRMPRVGLPRAALGSFSPIRRNPAAGPCNNAPATPTAGTRFVIEPPIRFEGQPGEQATMFLLDPCGNALQFKAFADRAQLFAK